MFSKLLVAKFNTLEITQLHHRKLNAVLDYLFVRLNAVRLSTGFNYLLRIAEFRIDIYLNEHPSYSYPILAKKPLRQRLTFSDTVGAPLKRKAFLTI